MSSCGGATTALAAQRVSDSGPGRLGGTTRSARHAGGPDRAETPTLWRHLRRNKRTFELAASCLQLTDGRGALETIEWAAIVGGGDFTGKADLREIKSRVLNLDNAKRERAEIARLAPRAAPTREPHLQGNVGTLASTIGRSTPCGLAS